MTRPRFRGGGTEVFDQYCFDQIESGGTHVAGAGTLSATAAVFDNFILD